MIKINLATKKGSSVSASKSGGMNSADIMAKLGGIKKFSDLSPSVKAMVVAGVTYGVILIAAYYFLESYKEKQLLEIQAEVAALESKLALVTSEIAKTSGYETLKNDLEADEKAMKTKIETIQKLVDERSVPPQILITFSKVTPRDVWVSNFSMRDNEKVEIAGSSYGLGVISDFMRALEETIYFKEVTLKSSTQSKVQGQEIAVFGLEAKRR